MLRISTQKEVRRRELLPQKKKKGRQGRVEDEQLQQNSTVATISGYERALLHAMIDACRPFERLKDFPKVASASPELKRRVAERTAERAPRSSSLDEREAQLRKELARLTRAIEATDGIDELIHRASEKKRELDAVISERAALAELPAVVNLDVKRIEGQARKRMAEFRALMHENAEGARAVLGALLGARRLTIGPAEGGGYVIRGTIVTGALLQVEAEEIGPGPAHESNGRHHARRPGA